MCDAKNTTEDGKCMDARKDKCKWYVDGKCGKMGLTMTDEEFLTLKAKIILAWEGYNLLQQEYLKQTGMEFKWFK